MNQELSNSLLLGIAGILLAIIGFFIVRYMNITSKKQDENAQNLIDNYLKLTEIINILQLSVTDLKGLIISMQHINDLTTKGCDKKHLLIDRTLKDHTTKLEKHDIKLAELVVKTRT